MNFTPDQERAVAERDGDRCVLAGAGSGKTRVLVERAARLVLEDGLPVSSLLAITFTEKAAREMKERLAKRFAETKRPEIRAEVEGMWVGTIHGFCSRLLRENAVEAGVDPGFEVLDEVQATTLLKHAAAEAAAELAAADPEAYLAVLSLGVPAGDLEGAVLRLYEDLRSAGRDPAAPTPPAGDPARLWAAMQAVIDAVASVEPLLASAPPKSAEKARAALDALPSLRAVLAEPPGPEAARAALAALDGLAGSMNLQVSKALGEILKPVREEAIPAAKREAAELLAEPMLAGLSRLLAAIHRRFRSEKAERGSLDFTDLETCALALLATVAPVRESLRARFRQILVDEYQDVNPVQARILSLLRDGGNHFAVGDVKQSIYGFRHAEPRIFAACAEEAREAGRVELPDNFRSSPGLVEFTNHCFGTLFAGSGLVAWRDMIAGAEYAPAAGPEVELLCVEADRADEARRIEAYAIARWIRTLVDEGRFRRRRPGPRHGEPLSFHDVAVLFRAMTDVKVYERAFEDLDVPYFVVKGRGFYQAREVADLVRLLESVANPRDEVALAAVLRSPFGGLTDDGLVSLVAAARAAGPGGRLADLLLRPNGLGDLPDSDREAFRRFAALHGRLRGLAARGTIRELVETALEESGYAAAAWMLRSAARRSANLRKAADLAASFDGRFDLADFLDALREFRLREVKETEAPTGGEEEDVVRLLTVHAAKGLEFPVVVLPDLARQPVSRPGGLLLGPDGVAAKVQPGPGEDPVETRSWCAAAEAHAAREAEERTRLLYVAVTRAEEHLLLSAREKADPGSAWGALSPMLTFDGEVAPYGASGRVVRKIVPEGGAPPVFRASLIGRHRGRAAAGEPLSPPDSPHLARARALLARADRPRPDPDASAFENTVSELVAWTICPRCCHERYQLGVGEPWEEDGDGPVVRGGADELPATERGTLVHEALRAWDPHGPVSLRDVADRLAGGRAALAREVAALVRSFYDSPDGAEVLAAAPEEVRREAPFLVRYAVTGPGKGLLFRGQLDLYYRRADGSLRIVDYKTGRPGRGGGALQLAVYARALAGLSGGAISAALAWLDAGGPATIEEVPLDEELSGRADRAAAEFAAWLAAGAPPPERHSGECGRGFRLRG